MDCFLVFTNAREPDASDSLVDMGGGLLVEALERGGRRRHSRRQRQRLHRVGHASAPGLPDWGGTRCASPRCTALFAQTAFTDLTKNDDVAPRAGGTPWWAPQGPSHFAHLVQEVFSANAVLSETFAAVGLRPAPPLLAWADPPRRSGARLDTDVRELHVRRARAEGGGARAHRSE